MNPGMPNRRERHEFFAAAALALGPPEERVFYHHANQLRVAEYIMFRNDVFGVRIACPWYESHFKGELELSKAFMHMLERKGELVFACDHPLSYQRWESWYWGKQARVIKRSGEVWTTKSQLKLK